MRQLSVGRLAKKLSYKLFAREIQIRSYVTQNLGKRAHFQVGVSWDGDVMLRTLEY